MNEKSINGCNIPQTEFLKDPGESQWGTVARCLRSAGLPVAYSIAEGSGMGEPSDRVKQRLLNEALTFVQATKIQIWEDKNVGLTTVIWQ